MMNKQMGKFLLIYKVILRNDVECTYLWIQHFILCFMIYISSMHVENSGRTKRKSVVNFPMSKHTFSSACIDIIRAHLSRLLIRDRLFLLRFFFFLIENVPKLIKCTVCFVF